MHFPWEVERSLAWAKIHRNTRSLPAITTGLYWKGLNPPWVQNRGEGAGMGPAEDTWIPAQDLHFPSGEPPEPLLLSPVYLAPLPTGLPPTQGRRRKNTEWILPKTAKLQNPKQLWICREHSLSQKNSLKTAALQCSHWQFRKVWRMANQQKTLDLFEQDSRLNVFNYRLCVLGSVLSLFQRGWPCFDNHISMSLLSHLSDAPRQDQRSKIWVLSALCWVPWRAWLSLCFPPLALCCFSPMRVPTSRSHPYCWRIYVLHSTQTCQGNCCFHSHLLSW